jgi:hypothetical protein
VNRHEPTPSIPHSAWNGRPAGHAFFNDTGSRFDAPAADEAWRRVIGWFDRDGLTVPGRLQRSEDPELERVRAFPLRTTRRKRTSCTSTALPPHGNRPARPSKPTTKEVRLMNVFRKARPIVLGIAIGLAGFPSSAGAHPHIASRSSHDQVLANGQNHPGFQSIGADGLRQSCSGSSNPPIAALPAMDWRPPTTGRTPAPRARPMAATPRSVTPPMRTPRSTECGRSATGRPPCEWSCGADPSEPTTMRPEPRGSRQELL